MDWATRAYDPAPMLRALDLLRRLDLCPAERLREVEAEVRGGSAAPVVERVAERLGVPAEVLTGLLRVGETVHSQSPAPPTPEQENAATILRDDSTSAARPTRGARELPEEVQRAAASPANRLGRYVLLGILGQGGMGVVHRAWDTSLARMVAVKTLRDDPSLATPHVRERFLREARAAARLRHPGIVAVHDVGEEQGRPFLTMDYIEGKTLAERMEAELPARREARPNAFQGLAGEVERIAQVAEAVGFAHLNGIVHRDLKPGNVLIDAAGRPLVSDFGLAKDLGASAAEAPPALTHDGALLGTPGYMSPEQAGGLPNVGPPSDVFSLGVILYETFTGRLPFRTDSLAAALRSVQSDDVVQPRRHYPRLSLDLETICLKCLERDATRRYPHAGELAADLRRWLAGEPILARPIAWPRKTTRWIRRHPVVTLLSVFTLALGLSAAAVQIHQAGLFAERLRMREEFGRCIAETQGAWRAGDRERLAASFQFVERKAAKLLSFEPDLGEITLQRGRMRLLTGDTEAAMPDLDRAVDLLGDLESAPWAERGRCWIARYRHGLEEARRDMPDPAAAANATTQDLEAFLGKLTQIRTQAARDLKQATLHRIPGPEGHLVLALLAWLSEDWRTVRTEADQSLALDVTPEAYWLRGVALQNEGRLAEAVEALDGAVASGRGFADAWISRADARAAVIESERHKIVTEIMQHLRPPRDADLLEDRIVAAFADARKAQELGADPLLVARVLGKLTVQIGELLRKLRSYRTPADSEHYGPSREETRARLLPLIDALERLDPRARDALVLLRLGQLWECYAISMRETTPDNRQELKQAIEYHSESLDRKPDFMTVYNWRGNAYFELALKTQDLGENPREWLHRAVADYSRNLAGPDPDIYARCYRSISFSLIADIVRQHGADPREWYAAAFADANTPKLDDSEALDTRTWSRLNLAVLDLQAARDVEPEMRMVLQELAPRSDEVHPVFPLWRAWAHAGIARSLEARGADASTEYRLAAPLYAIGSPGRLYALLWTIDAHVRMGDPESALADLSQRGRFPDPGRFLLMDEEVLPALERLGDFLEHGGMEASRVSGALDLAKVAAVVGCDLQPERMRDLAFRALAVARSRGGPDWKELAQSPELASLRADPRWGR